MSPLAHRSLMNNDNKEEFNKYVVPGVVERKSRPIVKGVCG